MFEGLRWSVVARLVRIARRSGLAIVGTAVVLACGCFDPPGAVLLNEDGEPVLLEDIDPILNNPDLTEEQKRDELLELGVTQELIDVLLQS